MSRLEGNFVLVAERVGGHVGGGDALGGELAPVGGQVGMAGGGRHRWAPVQAVSAVRAVDVAGLTPWGGMVLVTWFLFRLASEPGQTPSNDLTAIAVVIAIAALILRKD